MGIEPLLSKPTHQKYKIPVLYRSAKEGVKYRLSEILFPRDPKVREANLAFNREQMKNKLMILGTEINKEFNKKLEDSLASREKMQNKVIKDASMRILLKDYLYFKSDLSKRNKVYYFRPKTKRTTYQRNPKRPRSEKALLQKCKGN